MGRKLWIARSLAFAIEVGPWIFPMLGSLFLSKAVSAPGGIGQFLSNWNTWTALFLILLGTVPLAIKVSNQAKESIFETRARERETETLKLAAELISKIPVDSSLSRIKREERAIETRAEIIQRLGEQIYDDIESLRVIYFELDVSSGRQFFTPVDTFGCEHSPAKKHGEDDPRFHDFMKLIKSSQETSSESHTEERNYKSFVSACVTGSGGEVGYGLLTMDTASEFPFSEDDEQNLLLAAKLIGQFLDAALRGKHVN